MRSCGCGSSFSSQRQRPSIRAGVTDFAGHSTYMRQRPPESVISKPRQSFDLSSTSCTPRFDGGGSSSIRYSSGCCRRYAERAFPMRNSESRFIRIAGLLQTVSTKWGGRSAIRANSSTFAYPESNSRHSFVEIL